MKTLRQQILLVAYIVLLQWPSTGFCVSHEGVTPRNAIVEPEADSLSRKAAAFADTTCQYVEIFAEFDDISPEVMPSLPAMPELRMIPLTSKPNSIYELPYSLTGKCYDWKRLWINTATLCGAFIGSLIVLECLPEDATSWNRAELRDVPLFKRWRDHVITEGPEWDHDKFYFNYILHPYAGAAYFMAARSCGFNFWQSLLYCSLISNVGWEYGVEAFMERPSYQDLFITPLVGSVIGECFYKLKRRIVANDYRLGGSPVWGNIVAFLIDPVNEVIGLFGGNPARKAAKRMRSELTSSFVYPGMHPDMNFGFSMAYRF